MYSDPIAANNVKAQSRQQQQVTHCHPEFKPALSRVERVQDLSPPAAHTSPAPPQIPQRCLTPMKIGEDFARDAR